MGAFTAVDTIGYSFVGNVVYCDNNEFKQIIMSRERKFRAYHTEGGSDGMFSWDDIINVYKWTVDELFNDPTMIPMEWTGLKDKNGTEIYDGDIVEYMDLVLEVMFYKGHFIITDHKGHHEDLWKALDKSPLEVIGNKWKNPELLK